MDPNVTLALIAGYLRRGVDAEEGEELDYACQDLFDWLKSGGFAPDWDKYPTATGYYRCRAITHNRGGRVENGD